jgi:hypothetical protein
MLCVFIPANSTADSADCGNRLRYLAVFRPRRMADTRFPGPARSLCSDEILLSALARDRGGPQSGQTVLSRDYRAGNPVLGFRTGQPPDLCRNAPSAAGRARQRRDVRVGDRRYFSDDRAMSMARDAFCGFFTEWPKRTAPLT